MVRLRYSRVGNSLYTDWITLGPNMIVRAIVNSETYKYTIVQFNTEIVAEGQGFNLRHVKSIVRRRLQDAGVNFEGEIRSKQ